MCYERVRLHGLDLSTKHVVSDTREPEIINTGYTSQDGVFHCAFAIMAPWKDWLRQPALFIGLPRRDAFTAMERKFITSFVLRLQMLYPL